MVAMSEVFEAALEMGPDGLDPDWIDAALMATGSPSIRRRKVPAQHVLWLVLGMAMFAERSIVDVVEHLHLVLPGVTSLDSSAVTHQPRWEACGRGASEEEEAGPTEGWPGVVFDIAKDRFRRPARAGTRPA
jgi:hypothetical protein